MRRLPLDVTDDASIAAAAKQVSAEQDHLDVLVNNAGVGHPDAVPSEASALFREPPTPRAS